MRAWLNLRYTVPKRRAAFEAGLSKLGYQICPGMTNKPQKGDIFVTWNRMGTANQCAKGFQKRGLPVLVTENASWGNEFAGKRWYHMARGFHNTVGCFPVGDDSRWDDLGVDLAPWRTGGETLILPQRGLGSAPTAMPREWPLAAKKQHKARVRKHPGQHPAKPLEDDLQGVGKVVTWGSGAAIKALQMGVAVHSDMPHWIGEQNNTTEGRLEMFRRLAWAQWTLEEIAGGLPFERLL